MDDDLSISPWFALARAVQFGSCLLLFGTFAFERLVVAPAARDTRADLWRTWRPIARWLAALAIPGVLVSGAAWFAFVAIQMSGLPPGHALRGIVLSMVWRETHFGRLWKLRLLLCECTIIAALAAVSPLRCSGERRTIRVIIAGVLSGALAGSLAWAGHGQTGEHLGAHLAADVLHIGVGGVWPVGLLPFAWMLLKLRRVSGTGVSRDLAALTSRFSAASLAAVALLTGTGVVNSWLLVGPLPNLWQTAYGRVLLLKIGFFLLMLLLGAVNLKRLKPRLAVLDPSRRAAGRLLGNVLVELALAMLVLAAVGLLGLLPPGTEGMMHHSMP